MARMIIKGYRSDQHISDLQAKCPLLALPPVAERANDKIRLANQSLLRSSVWSF